MKQSFEIDKLSFTEVERDGMPALPAGTPIGYVYRQVFLDGLKCLQYGYFWKDERHKHQDELLFGWIETSPPEWAKASDFVFQKLTRHDNEPGDPVRIKELVDALSAYPAKIFTVGELYLMFSCPASIHAQRQLEALIQWAQKEQF